jgi:hypothetical protein
MLACLIAAMAVPFLSAADHPDGEGATNRPGQPSSHPTTRPDVPVVYTSFGRFHRLTPEQTKLILDTAMESRPKDRDIWFVAVQYIGTYRVWAMVCYTPDESSPRVRRGWFSDIHVRREAAVVVWKKPDGGRSVDVVYGRNDKLEMIRPGQYVQVSRPGKPFGQKLEVPATADLPFPAPFYPPAVTGDGEVKRLDDEGLVRLVDFARSVFKPRDGDDPICSVVGTGDDLFGVAQGVSDWGGDFIHVRRKGEKFEVTASGGWADADTIWWPPPRSEKPRR